MSENFHETVLIEGLKEGNVKIFDYLFHLYYTGLVAFAMKYVSEKEVAEDLVQDFFYKLWLDRSKLQINQTIKAYFFTAIKNKSFDYVRHQSVKSKASEFFKTNTVQVTEQGEDYLIESELNERIEMALKKLPEKCRQVFMQNRFEGLKPIEIAEKENLSVRTVEAHIGKALKILRTELEPYLPTSLVALVLANLSNFMK